MHEGDARRPGVAAGAGADHRLYRNTRDGTFSDVTDALRPRPHGWASRVCAGDYDNDGRARSVRHLLRHQRPVPQPRRRPLRGRHRSARACRRAATRWGSGCTFVDYDRDGRLDLFVSNYLRFDLATAAGARQGVELPVEGHPGQLRAQGPADRHEPALSATTATARFADVSEASGIASVTGRYSMTAAAADFDERRLDGHLRRLRLDRVDPLPQQPRRHVHRRRASQSGVAYSENGKAQAGMGLAVGDYDRDGRLDLFKTHFADDIPALYRNLGKGLFEDVGVAAGLARAEPHVEWGAGMPDLDNDGWPDIVYMTGNVYPEIERTPAAVSAPRPAHRLPQRGGGALRGRDARQRVRARRRRTRAAAPPSATSTTTATSTCSS